MYQMNNNFSTINLYNGTVYVGGNYRSEDWRTIEAQAIKRICTLLGILRFTEQPMEIFI